MRPTVASQAQRASTSGAGEAAPGAAPVLSVPAFTAPASARATAAASNTGGAGVVSTLGGALPLPSTPVLPLGAAEKQAHPDETLLPSMQYITARGVLLTPYTSPNTFDPYTLHPTPYTLHPAPYTLQPTPCKRLR